MAYAPRILIVEDNHAVRRFFERVLSEDGYYVTGVATERQALRSMHDTSFDVVIVDMSLPDADGPNMIRWITSEFPFARTLALSGAMGIQMRGLALLAGATEVLSKPLTPREIRSAVYRALDASGSWQRSQSG